MGVDEDEKLDHMCPKCRQEVTSNDKCIRCGEKLDHDTFVNPNFDVDRFNKLNGNETKVTTIE